MALVISCSLAAQDASLRITVVSGEGAVQAAGAHVTKPLTVQVSDGSGRPVEGARVSFQVPEDGPGGVFSTGLRTDVVTTDSSGRATVRSLQLNRVAGSFSIRITAAKEQARAGTVVKQSIGEASVPPAASVAAPTPATERPQPVAAKVTPPAPTPATPASVPTVVTSRPKAALEAAASPAKLMPQAIPQAMTQAIASGVPTIVITQKSGKPMAEVGSASGGGSHKKWIWMGLLAGAAAGGVAAWRMGLFAGQTGTGSAAGLSSLSSAASIGAPTISLGKP